MYINSAPKNNSLSFLKHNRLNAKKPHSVRKQGFGSTFAPKKAHSGSRMTKNPTLTQKNRRKK